jgi:hypothetical protein
MIASRRKTSEQRASWDVHAPCPSGPRRFISWLMWAQSAADGASENESSPAIPHNCVGSAARYAPIGVHSSIPGAGLRGPFNMTALESAVSSLSEPCIAPPVVGALHVILPTALGDATE